MGYDWSNMDWKLQDHLYASKRKVNNRNSHQHPHIIGSFYSHRMERTVEYESLGERLFYYYLELDHSVVRYYVQPVEILIHKQGEESWKHTPDILVFRENTIPFLYQVKHEPDEEKDERLEQVNYFCEGYARSQGWEYLVIYPKMMPSVLIRNIRFLKGFLKERSYYSEWIDKVVYRLVCLEMSTVDNLADCFSDEYHPLLIKPLIYHLIARGLIHTDVNQNIGSNSSITVNQLTNIISDEKQVLIDVHQST
ncbi:TnsA endonuclease N-terminal domain-containing protein [Paenibacillus paridis]|uniref:TnsA endonuclease N-terminal domain-containing protein n=1 Tax=Paenibacillus paridis TaxID=2583376 RepID=UPI001122804E|nr:TnsA endonuclease N-terminal domain-containing protein [Paenibacillus paridis]